MVIKYGGGVQAYLNKFKHTYHGVESTIKKKSLNNIEIDYNSNLINIDRNSIMDQIKDYSSIESRYLSTNSQINTPTTVESQDLSPNSDIPFVEKSKDILKEPKKISNTSESILDTRGELSDSSPETMSKLVEKSTDSSMNLDLSTNFNDLVNTKGVIGNKLINSGVNFCDSFPTAHISKLSQLKQCSLDVLSNQGEEVGRQIREIFHTVYPEFLLIQKTSSWIMAHEYFLIVGLVFLALPFFTSMSNECFNILNIIFYKLRECLHTFREYLYKLFTKPININTMMDYVNNESITKFFNTIKEFPTSNNSWDVTKFNNILSNSSGSGDEGGDDDRKKNNKKKSFIKRYGLFPIVIAYLLLEIIRQVVNGHLPSFFGSISSYERYRVPESNITEEGIRSELYSIWESGNEFINRLGESMAMFTQIIEIIREYIINTLQNDILLRSQPFTYLVNAFGRLQEFTNGTIDQLRYILTTLYNHIINVSMTDLIEFYNQDWLNELDFMGGLIHKMFTEFSELIYFILSLFF